MRVLTIISDRLETGVLAYHATTVSLKTVFFTRMIWVSGYIYFLMAPFVFVGKIALGPWLITDHVAWGHFFVVLLCGVLLSVSYLFCWIGLLNSIDTFEHMWERGVEPVMWFGGSWVPAYAIIQSGVPGVALISRLNPFTYFSDGIRQVFLPEVRFASLTTCYSAMLISTVPFSLVGYYLLKTTNGSNFMNMHSWRIFTLLLWRQWFVIRKNMPDMIGDGLIAVSLQLISLKFFLPAMGMSTKWQLPLFVGNMLMLSFTVGYQYGLTVASDIASEKVLYYHITLPVAPQWVLGSYILGAMASFFCPVNTGWYYWCFIPCN